MFIIAPEANFSGGRIVSLTGAILSPDPTVAVQNGVSYQATRIYSTFGPIQATGGTITVSDIPGAGDQFLVIPDSDFDASDNPTTLANAFIANDTTLTLSNIAYRICALTQASAPFMARGQASPFGVGDWQWLPKTTATGDQLDFVLVGFPNDGGYPITDIDLQIGTDDGLGGVTWGSVQNIGLASTSVTVLAMTKTWARIRPVTAYGDNPWSTPKSATPAQAVTNTTVTFDSGQSVTIQGNYEVFNYADGGRAVIAPSGSVTVISKNPATVGAGTSALRHGAMKNPVHNRQGFDGRITANLQHADTVTFPATLATNDVLVPALSKTSGIFNSSDPARSGYIDTYDVLHVVTSRPADGSLSPQITLGSTATRTTPTVVDYLSKASLLPSTYPLTGSYRTKSEISRAFRLNPGMALRRTDAASDGYELMTPAYWGLYSASTGTSNYGRYSSETIGDLLAHLFAPVSSVPLDIKAEILMRLDSHAWQLIQPWRNAGFNPTNSGGHWQNYQASMILHFWLRDDFASLATFVSDLGGNWSTQFFEVTADMAANWFTPYGNPDSPSSAFVSDKPAAAYRRRVTAVNDTSQRVSVLAVVGGSGGSQGDYTKAIYNGMMLNRESDGFQAFISASSQPANVGNGDTMTFTLDTWPAGGFAVGDVVYMTPEVPFVEGVYDWNSFDRPNTFIPTENAQYRFLQNELAHIQFFHLMGIVQPEMKPTWEYCKNTGLPGSWPTARNNYPFNITSNGLAREFWNTYQDAIIAVPQPYLGEAPLSPYYPNVPAVDVTAAAGSLMFPEGNNGGGAQTLTTYKGALYQSNAGITFPNGSSAQATFAIVRWPKDKRWVSESAGIVGTTATSSGYFWWMRYWPEVGSSNPTRFEFRQSGSGSILSAPWTEDAALVVAWCNGASSWRLDWYSLKDGTRYTSTAVTGSGTAISQLVGSQFNIGRNGTGTTYTANGTSGASIAGWPGEIEAVGIVRGVNATDTAKWANIALGSSVVSEMGFANLRWYRQLDGTSATYGPVSGETNDPSTTPLVPFAGGTDIPAATLRPGSHIRRQSLTNYLTIDGISDGWVYGIMAEDTERSVTFSGKAGGYTGAVEVQVYDRDNGAVVRDWTACGTIAGGAWSGSFTLPKTQLRSNGDGWWACRARIASAPTVIADRKTAFGVGWKILFSTQSQGAIAINNGASVPLDAPMTGSYVENGDGPNGSGWHTPSMSRIGMVANTQGVRTFLNQWRKGDSTTPIMLIRDAINGTAMLDLMQDTAARRWYSLTDKITAYGNDVSVVAHNWGTTESNLGNAGYKTRLDGFFFNTGADATGRSLSAILQPGFKVAISPLTRYGDATTHDTVRVAGVEWANANGHTVGPPTSDMFVMSDQGPHEPNVNIMGPNLVMSRMALAAMKAVGVISFQNPHFTGATISADRTQITISVALPNGGSLYCPGSVRNLRINGSYSGFTAAVVGNQVVATINSGTWPANVSVSYSQNGETRARAATNNDPTVNAIEQAIIDGFLYETFAADVIGRGLPVLGSLSSGQWVPTWSTTVP